MFMATDGRQTISVSGNLTAADDRELYGVSYELVKDGIRIRVPAELVVFSKSIHPPEGIGGYSPLTKVAVSMDILKAIGEANAASFKKFAPLYDIDPNLADQMADTCGNIAADLGSAYAVFGNASQPIEYAGNTTRLLPPGWYSRAVMADGERIDDLMLNPVPADTPHIVEGER